MNLHPLIAGQRRALADQLDGLTAEQWATPSLCAGWTVHDVVAHLTVPLTVQPAKAAVMFVKSRFDIDATVKGLTAVRAVLPSATLVATLREKADSTFEPPGSGPGAPLTDVLVHGQDIRRPLGIAYVAPPEVLTGALDFLTGNRTRGFMPKGRAKGLRFEPTDLAWRGGDGPVVRGPATSLAMVLCGRAVALDDLEGDGVEVLRSRL